MIRCAVMSVPDDREHMCASFMPPPNQVGRGAHRIYYVYLCAEGEHQFSERFLETLRHDLFIEYQKFTTMEEAKAWVEADCEKRLMH